MEKIINYIRTHRRQHLDELFQFVRIPSVSTVLEHAQDVAACGKFLADHLETIGMKNVQVMPTKGHPVVYAEWLGVAEAPTILIYGHYDVQPPDPLELWDSPPFEPEIRDEKIYARGVADDKGQLFAYVKAIKAYLQEDGELPLNVKMIVEGEEEIGSENLFVFVEEHAELLKADAILLSDSGMFAPGIPTICYGTRGLVHCQIDLESAARDLHSGRFGGIVANPIQVLADILSALKDRDGRISIPGFYDDVVDITDTEKQMLDALVFDEDTLKQEIGVSEFVGEKGFSNIERRWTRPTLDVNGIVSGFTGEGLKTIIPGKAMAKITMRLVPNQNPEGIFKATKDYIEQLAPSTAKLTITTGAAGKSYVTPIDHPILPFILKALDHAYNHDPVFIRTGGTIGILSTLSEVLHIPILMIGLSQPGDNAHAPNEHLSEEAFYKGIEVAAHLLNELRAWKPE